MYVQFVHVKTICVSEDKKKICFLSSPGDGMFNEVVGALVEKATEEAGEDINDPRVTLRRPKVRVGVIPAGENS